MTIAAATPRDARQRVLLAARAELVERGELEMGDVAARAGVGRSSLYRMCGDREGLREMVVAWMAEVGWARAERAAARNRGRARCLAVLAEYARLVAEDEGLRKSMRKTPELALGLCTDHLRSVQPWVVARVQELVMRHAMAGDVALNMPADRLAYAIVRLSESFLYADAMADRPVDLEALATLTALLLPAPSDRRCAGSAT